MEVLAERVVDILEEQHKVDSKEITKKEDYINFENEYFDDILADLSNLKKKFEEYRELQTEIENAARTLTTHPDVYINSFALTNGRADTINDAIKTYLERQKEKKFPTVSFNREKMLRKVQADILLSEVGNPEEIVKQTASKYASTTTAD